MADYFEVEAMVRGYDRYREIWEAEVGEQLECRRENSNLHDIPLFRLFVVVVITERTSTLAAAMDEDGITFAKDP